MKDLYLLHFVIKDCENDQVFQRVVFINYYKTMFKRGHCSRFHETKSATA